MYPLWELAFFFFCSSLFGLCSTASLPVDFSARLFAGSFASRWQFTQHGPHGDSAAAIWRPTAKERHHQLVSGGSSSVTFATRPIRHVEVSCHLPPLTFLQTLQCEIGKVRLVNHTLSKISKKLKQSKPLMEMKVDMWRPSLLPTLCVAKFQSGNSCTSKSPPGFCSHWQSALLCGYLFCFVMECKPQ